MKYPFNVNELDEVFFSRITNGDITESDTLDFKQSEYLFTTKEDKKKTLSDIVGMLNANGGLILLGVTDDGELLGLTNINYDQYRLRLIQTIETNIEPQVVGILIRNVTASGKQIIAISIPVGNLKPHAIKMQGHHSYEFIIRQDGANQSMRLDQIRKAMMTNASLSNMLADWDVWKNLKLQEILGNSWKKPLVSGPSLVVLINPCNSSPTDEILPTDKILAITDRTELLQPPGSSGFTEVPSHEGVFTLGRERCDYGEGKPCFSFVEVTQNGAVQIFDSTYIKYFTLDKEISQSIDEQLFRYISRALMILVGVGFTGHEYQIRIIFLGCKGFKVKPTFVMPGAVTTSPGIPLDNYEVKSKINVGEDYVLAMKPLMDRIWQASGFTRCLRYNESGAFIAGQHEE